MIVANGQHDRPEDAASQPRWLRHEILLLTLGSLTAVALIIRAGPFDPTTIHSLIATSLLGIVILVSQRNVAGGWQKVRFAAAYAFVVWFYLAVESIVPALRNPPRDTLLLAADESMFGQTPAAGMQSWSSLWLNELMSGCYLSYLVYLHVCLVHAMLLPVERTRRLAEWLFSIYAIGLAGYLMFPAVGPATAFPELFESVIEGAFLTDLNRAVVQSGSSVFDAFPSLHVLVTCALLAEDRRTCRWRFYTMLAPAVGIFTSAIYLRYHYAVDLIAGGILFVLARVAFQREA